MIGIVASLVAIAAFVIAQVGGEDESASRSEAAELPEEAIYAESILRKYHTAQYDQLYDEFHPALQKLVPRELYTRCETQAGLPASLIRLEFLSIGADDIDAPGLEGTTLSQVNFMARLGTPEGTQAYPESVDILEFEGNPRFMLRQYEIDSYMADRCPDIPTSIEDAQRESSSSGAVD